MGEVMGSQMSLCPYFKAVHKSLPIAQGICLRTVESAKVATGIYNSYV